MATTGREVCRNTLPVLIEQEKKILQKADTTSCDAAVAVATAKEQSAVDVDRSRSKPAMYSCTLPSIAPFLRWLVTLYCCVGALHAVQVTRDGVIPSYEPQRLGHAFLFLPYAPTVLIATDRASELAQQVASQKEHATIFCFSPEREDFKKLCAYSDSFPNIKPYFGPLHIHAGRFLYFSTLPHDTSAPSYRFAGSVLKPVDPLLPFLFGDTRFLSTYSTPQFCRDKNLSRIDFIHLDCGGNELQILQSIPDLTRNAIVVFVKTYHRKIRSGISMFKEVDEFMSASGFELLSHHIYDGTIGDALYVQQRYLNAVFRRSQI